MRLPENEAAKGEKPGGKPKAAWAVAVAEAVVAVADEVPTQWPTSPKGSLESEEVGFWARLVSHHRRKRARSGLTRLPGWRRIGTSLTTPSSWATWQHHRRSSRSGSGCTKDLLPSRQSGPTRSGDSLSPWTSRSEGRHKKAFMQEAVPQTV